MTRKVCGTLWMIKAMQPGGGELEPERLSDFLLVWTEARVGLCVFFNVDVAHLFNRTYSRIVRINR